MTKRSTTPRNVPVRTAIKAGADLPTPTAIYVLSPAGCDAAKTDVRTATTAT